MTQLQQLVRQARGGLNGALARATLGQRSRAVMDERLTYLGPRKLGRLERAADAALASGASGNVLEFGVALGGSAIVLGAIAVEQARSFHGFDVFGMIPPPTSAHDDEKSKARYAVIAAGASEGIGGETYYGYRPDLYGDVCQAFARHGLPVDGTRIVLHKGLFEDTWPGYAERVAFAHIDCDWYDPVKFCLESVAAKMDAGGRIVLDDYHDYGGCRVATDEFLGAHPEFVPEDGANLVLVKT
jgi:O-methyltransferase